MNATRFIGGKTILTLPSSRRMSLLMRLLLGMEVVRMQLVMVVMIGRMMCISAILTCHSCCI